MISIKPKWCELIASGKKTIEIRKTRPKIDTPFKCYIYCTNSGRPLVWGSPTPYLTDERLTQTYGYSREDAEKIFGCWNGKVIGEFVCDEIYTIDCDSTGFFYKGKQGYVKKELEYNSCLLEGDIFSYLFPNVGYSWHISELKIYDEPKEINEFYNLCDESLTDIESNKCKKCIYHRDKNEMSLTNDQNCVCNGAKPITRAPQSWCYVDKLR